MAPSNSVTDSQDACKASSRILAQVKAYAVAQWREQSRLAQARNHLLAGCLYLEHALRGSAGPGHAFSAEDAVTGAEVNAWLALSELYHWRKEAS